ncbi:hypothetical protein [Mesorhizobium sp. M0159]
MIVSFKGKAVEAVAEGKAPKGFHRIWLPVANVVFERSKTPHN